MFYTSIAPWCSPCPCSVQVAEQALLNAHQDLEARGAELPKVSEELQFDEAECDEAIIFCLDISNSMNDHCGFTDKPPDEEDENSDDDELGEELEALLNTDSVGPTFRRLRTELERGEVTEVSDEEVLASHGTDVFTALVELRCHESAADMAAIMLAFPTKHDRTFAATKVLVEWCKEAGSRAAQLQRAGLIASHVELFLKALLNPTASASLGGGGAADDAADAQADFSCPITQAVMIDPVFAADGFSYERSAIELWLASHDTSPMTGLVLNEKRVIPNRNLKSQIAARRQADADNDEEEDSDDDLFGDRARSISERADQEEDEEEEEDTRLEVVFRGRSVRVRCSDLVSVRALCKLTEQALVAARAGSFDSFGSLELRHGNRRLAPSRTLRSYGILPGAAESTLKASQGIPCSTFSVLVTKTRHGISTPLLVKSTETGQALLWRVCRVAAEGTGQIRTCAALLPSKTHLWAGLKDSGDGHQTGRHIERSELVSDLKAYDRGPSDEVLEITLDYSSPTKPHGPGFLSRLLATKQLFHALINRTEAYSFTHSVGLVLFGTDVKTASPISPYLDSFKHTLDTVKCAGDTCCYDALVEAADILQKFVQARPQQTANTRLRIVCLSDGKDNKSTRTPAAVASRLQADGVLLDAIMIGDAPADLQAVAKSTGGYAFHPKKLKDALRLVRNPQFQCVVHFMSM